MRVSARRALGALGALLVGWGLSPLGASAESASATIIHDDRERACAGESATLVWSAPEGVDGLTGYEITHQIITPAGPRFPTYIVGAPQTSLPFEVPFGVSIFLIRAITAQGIATTPFASATMNGSIPPMPMVWDQAVTQAAVGDGRATVAFKWPGPVTWSSTGGFAAATIQITSSSGASIVRPIQDIYGSVAATFTGLTNGQSYTFTAVTSNVCGSRGPSSTPRYTPGAAPEWTQADPPLTVPKNKTYSYGFLASGSPAPTYRLIGAPEWLTLGPDGVVTGDPPKDTTSFSYSIEAANGVGVGGNGEPWFLHTQKVAGPFTVTVVKGWQGANPQSAQGSL